MAENDQLDVAERDLESVHVLDDAVRAHPRIEEDPVLTVSLGDGDERRETMLGHELGGRQDASEYRRLHARPRCHVEEVRTLDRP